MDQQQFKVSLSVGTKLLISVVALLVVFIVFLNLSTIFLLKEDKRAYTYQSQSTEGVLAGKEFVTTLKHSIDTLRISLGSIDPLKPVTPQQTTALQTIIDNQSELLHVSLQRIEGGGQKLTLLTQALKPKELKDLDLKDSDLTVSPTWLKIVMPELLKNSYAFINMSKMAGAISLGIVLADLKLKDNAGGMPVAIGILSLKEYSDQLAGLNLTVATRTGWVIFDTDSTTTYSKRNIKEDPLFTAALASRAAGAMEYDTGGKHYLGSYVQPGLDVVILIKTEWEKALKATYALVEKFVLLGLMAIAAGVVFAIFFSKTLTAPINKLYQATKDVAAGKFDLQLQITGRDELAALTGSFNAMSKQIVELIKDRVEKVRIENEIAIASTVQQTLIPPPEFKTKNIQIYSNYQSANECGGDWWGFFGVGPKLCIMIADATGHGLPSALITASARSCMSILHKLAQEDPDFTFSPSAMLAYANRVVHDAALGKIMMTFFIGVFDFESKTLTYSSAGHNPPWLFRKEKEKYNLKSLVSLGQRLGESRDVNEFEEKTVEIGPDDVLFMYTDGVIEGKNLAGEMYGKKRTRSLVQAQVANGPEKVVKTLIDDFLKYNKGKSLDDDVTIAVAKVLDSGATSPNPVGA